MKKTLLTTVILALTLVGCKPEQEQLPPEIKITSGESVSIPAEGGSVTVAYEVTNPVEGAVVTASVPEDVEWITSVQVQESDGLIAIEAGINEIEAERSTELTVVYTYDGGEVTATAALVQAPGEPWEPFDPNDPSDYKLKASVFTGYYYGTTYAGNGEYVYDVWLSDMPLDAKGETQYGGTYYMLSVYVENAPAGMDALVIPEGTYTLGERGESFAGTFDYYESKAISTTEAGEEIFLTTFSEGTLTVSMQGAAYIFDATLVDVNGKTHHVAYKGQTPVQAVVDDSPVSTLMGDYPVNIPADAIAYAMYGGDYYSVGGGEWIVAIMPQKDGDGLALDLVTESLSYEDGIPSGTYNEDDGGYPDPGQYNRGYIGTLESPGGTMYFDILDQSYDGFAPAVSGALEVENHGDGSYTLSFDFVDDKGYKWYGEWSGAVMLFDQSATTSDAVPAAVRKIFQNALDR